ncbi:heavy-metal-associated domain-containing protein [Jejuia pallidilutea]|uniref:HMA domain-containing protein n=1 Tax=Jejuia pallidilutea TaxID=504487 RepID=A0A090WX51_9FLAO|nr:heavy-metal-associated domain-containing protein [Jejuia pallidilutea]GAL68468.1 hypothetical protein JCM19301_111 [Jejuia pallidilutea]GAL71937.1 hypothetical protein JCM19302_444 [Jejuia pallidilutea]GAL89589.1 hypothetical protein JCM19538_571 [Jejuia pallidilutea]
MKTTLEIQNLKCGGCANTIINKLSTVSGIDTVSVNTEHNTVELSYESEAHLEDAKKLLKTIGYPIAGDKNALGTKAKSFVSCAIGRVNS